MNDVRTIDMKNSEYSSFNGRDFRLYMIDGELCITVDVVNELIHLNPTKDTKSQLAKDIFRSGLNRPHYRYVLGRSNEWDKDRYLENMAGGQGFLKMRYFRQFMPYIHATNTMGVNHLLGICDGELRRLKAYNNDMLAEQIKMVEPVVEAVVSPAVRSNKEILRNTEDMVQAYAEQINIAENTVWKAVYNEFESSTGLKLRLLAKAQGTKARKFIVMIGFLTTLEVCAKSIVDGKVLGE